MTGKKYDQALKVHDQKTTTILKTKPNLSPETKITPNAFILQSLSPPAKIR